MYWFNTLTLIALAVDNYSPRWLFFYLRATRYRLTPHPHFQLLLGDYIILYYVVGTYQWPRGQPTQSTNTQSIDIILKYPQHTPGTRLITGVRGQSISDHPRFRVGNQNLYIHNVIEIQSCRVSWSIRSICFSPPTYTCAYMYNVMVPDLIWIESGPSLQIYRVCKL
jgi:hypothetical protein